MNGKFIIAGALLTVSAVYVVFFHIGTCVKAAHSRNSFFTNVGVCPPFVKTSVEGIKAEFKNKVTLGESKEAIEKAFNEMGLTYSWDRFQNKYNAIIRHPDSNFHAITIKVFVDENGKFKEIMVRDSFTAL